MKSMRRIFVAAGLAVSLTVAGCSGPWSSSPQSPPPADGGTFETLEDLRVAVEGAGFQCPELQLANHAKYASASGYCGEVGMALYPNDASLAAQLAMRTPQAQTAVNVGRNWTVTTAAPDQVKRWLGGDIVPAGE